MIYFFLNRRRISQSKQRNETTKTTNKSKTKQIKNKKKKKNMDFSKSFTHNGKYGIKFQPITNYQTAMTVHPDHVGFVIGFNGGTIKKVAHECDCYIRIQEPNEFSKGWPWFVFKGDHPDKICEAFRQISNIAKEAERRMPRINQQKATQEKPTEVKATQENPTEEKPTEVKATQAKDGWHVRMKGGDDTLSLKELQRKCFLGMK